MACPLTIATRADTHEKTRKEGSRKWCKRDDEDDKKCPTTDATLFVACGTTKLSRQFQSEPRKPVSVVQRRKGPIRDVSRAGLEALACREGWPGACDQQRR